MRSNLVQLFHKLKMERPLIGLQQLHPADMPALEVQALAFGQIVFVWYMRELYYNFSQKCHLECFLRGRTALFDGEGTTRVFVERD